MTQYHIHVGDTYRSLFETLLVLSESLPPMDHKTFDDRLQSCFPREYRYTGNCPGSGTLPRTWKPEYVGFLAFGEAMGFRKSSWAVYQEWVRGKKGLPEPSAVPPPPPLPAQFQYLRPLFDGPLRQYRNIYGCTAMFWCFPVLYVMVTGRGPMVDIVRSIEHPNTGPLQVYHWSSEDVVRYKDLFTLLDPLCDVLYGEIGSPQRTRGVRYQTDVSMAFQRNCECFVMVEVGIPVAAALISWTDQTVGHMFVHAFCAATRLGKGRQLMQYLQSKADRITLVSLADGFYERMGFRPTRDRTGWSWSSSTGGSEPPSKRPRSDA